MADALLATCVLGAVVIALAVDVVALVMWWLRRLRT
jgi:multisubunit Na+/H+ antiporter MnhC subunit